MSQINEAVNNAERPAVIFDGLQALPFRFELLKSLTRAEVAVLSAVIYAARLRAWGEEFPLSDFRIADLTGYCPRHIRRIRKRLLERGLFSVARRSRHGVNYYTVDRAQAHEILRCVDDEHRERIYKKLQAFPEQLRPLAEAFHRATGAMPSRKWLMSLYRLWRMGRSPEWIAQAVAMMRERGRNVSSPFALIRFALKVYRHEKRAKRARAKGKTPAERVWTSADMFGKRSRKFYYAYDPNTNSYYPLKPLPRGSKFNVYENPLPLVNLPDVSASMNGASASANGSGQRR
ncbi:MAG: hypothetical protein ACK4JD_13110 [Thermoflexales bacterium]